jgi:hypothetical protein
MKIRTTVVIVAGSLTSIANAITVGGIISTNTTWSNTSEIYTFSSTVQIKNGVTLTVGPGVILDAGSIKVFGNLIIDGSINAPVKLTGVKIIPAGNGDLSKIFSINIDHADFTGGSLYYPTGNAIYGSISLQDSILENIPYMYVWYPTSVVSIQRNIFTNSGGISVGSSNVDVLIENNVFNAPSNYAVQNWASYGTSVTTVRYNSFLNTNQQVVQLPAGYNSAKLDARYNYWGTTNANTIESMIFDENDDLSSGGTIPYAPFLTARHANTPSLSPVPEPESYLLFLVGLVGIAAPLKRSAKTSAMQRGAI